jgi:hypothetical protein
MRATPRRILAEVDTVLDGFAHNLLMPRMVEEVLGITARERPKWTKDGRLPKSGLGSFKRGLRTIHFPLHPAHKIAALAADPPSSRHGVRPTPKRLARAHPACCDSCVATLPVVGCASGPKGCHSYCAPRRNHHLDMDVVVLGACSALS